MAEPEAAGAAEPAAARPEEPEAGAVAEPEAAAVAEPEAAGAAEPAAPAAEPEAAAVAEPTAPAAAPEAPAEPEAAAPAEPEAATAEPWRRPTLRRRPSPRSGPEPRCPQSTRRPEPAGLSPRPLRRARPRRRGGKPSTALGALGGLPSATISSDAVVHEPDGSDEPRDAVTARRAPEVARGGVVDGAAVARQAFGPPTSARGRGRRWPRMRVAGWRAALDDEGRRRAPPSWSSTLLFEAGLEGAYDATIAVVADEDVLAERAAARLGHHAIDERSARQLSQEEKAARATYVVANERNCRAAGACAGRGP